MKGFTLLIKPLWLIYKGTEVGTRWSLMSLPTHSVILQYWAQNFSPDGFKTLKKRFINTQMATKPTWILGIWQNSTKALFLFRIFEHLSGQAGSSGSEQPTGRHLVTPSKAQPEPSKRSLRAYTTTDIHNHEFITQQRGKKPLWAKTLESQIKKQSAR